MLTALDFSFGASCEEARKLLGGSLSLAASPSSPCTPAAASHAQTTFFLRRSGLVPWYKPTTLMGQPDPFDSPPCDSKECKPLKPKIPTVLAPPPASSPSSHARSTFVTGFIIAGSALAFLIICISLFLLVRRRRRRRQRRRQEALLEAALAAAAPDGGGGGEPDLEEEAEQGEVVHHAWHIRTVGLDEAAIESIALTRYRAGGGGGTSDCAVCLGEFADGELLRLLPRCAHAFHVPCIDTWLRAHVNCPLCRSHVLDPVPAPAAAAEQQQSDSPAGTDADAGQAVSIVRTTTEQGPLDEQASEQRELRVQIDRHDGESNSPEQPHRPPGRNFRRVVSMDSPPPITSAEEAADPEDERVGGEKQGTDGAVHRELSSSPGSSGRLKTQRGMKRSLSAGSRWALISRHCRRSSSLLPL